MFFSGLCVIALAGGVTFNYNANAIRGNLSNLALVNVEALASIENVGSVTRYQLATVTEPYGNGGTITCQCCKEGGNLLSCGGYNTCD